MADGKITVKDLLDEYSLSIDDMRWYKSCITAERLLSYSDTIMELVDYIWSGRLSDDLYNIEERYLEDLQDQIDRGLLEETGLREILAEAYAQKNKRSWK